MSRRWNLASSFAIVLFVGPAPALAAEASDPSRVFEGAPPDARLGGAVTLDGYHDWKPYLDLAAWTERRAKVRRQILVAAGLWPLPPKTDLRPAVHGAIDRGAYTVEKVFFESLPGFYVTGNLYRPRGGSGRRPGVLSPHGHWQNGRFYEASEEEARREIDRGAEKTVAGARYPLQARCAQLARMGCVVFHYDMVGTADSKQLGHAAGFGDLEAELRLQSAFGLQTWNSIRALDFLASLPDVDPGRIGVTGASGGGTQTFILCAIDDRPAVAFPAVMVSTDMQGGCVCENASHLRVGTTNIEFAALAAPRPYGMTGANDWTREILTKGLPELKAQWRAYGKEELVEAFCHPEFGHNYNQVSREHMYEWMDRHLGLGQPRPVREAPFEPIPPAELSVFDAEHPRPAGAVDAAGLRKYLSETSDRQLAAILGGEAVDLPALREVVGGALEAMLHTGLPRPGEVEARETATVARDGWTLERLAFARKGTGEAVPAILLRPERWGGAVVVGIGVLGKRNVCFRPSGELREEVERLLELGAAVLSIDAFLTGEYLGEGAELARTRGADLEAFPKDKERHARYVGYTYGYNRTLIAQRVHDVLTAVGYARSLDGCRSVRLAGLGEAASWAVLARALAGGAVERLAVAPVSPDPLSEVPSLDAPDFLPGARKYGGLPAFAALGAPGETLWISTAPPPPLVVRAYRAAGRPEALRHYGERTRAARDEILERLAR